MAARLHAALTAPRAGSRFGFAPLAAARTRMMPVQLCYLYAKHREARINGVAADFLCAD